MEKLWKELIIGIAIIIGCSIIAGTHYIMLNSVLRGHEIQLNVDADLSGYVDADLSGSVDTNLSGSIYTD